MHGMFGLSSPNHCCAFATRHGVLRASLLFSVCARCALRGHVAQQTVVQPLSVGDGSEVMKGEREYRADHERGRMCSDRNMETSSCTCAPCVLVWWPRCNGDSHCMRSNGGPLNQRQIDITQSGHNALSMAHSSKCTPPCLTKCQSAINLMGNFARARSSWLPRSMGKSKS